MTSADVPRTREPEEPGGVVPMGPGPSEGLVRSLSRSRREPEWMLRLRLRGLERLRTEGIPSWAAFLRDVDFDGMLDSGESGPPQALEFDDSPSAPGLGALAASEQAYREVRKDLEARGIRFYGLSTALGRMPDPVRTYLMSIIPPDDDPLAALNAALATEGSFVYVPPGVSVPIPLQAEIREDYAKVQPFERSLIVADRGSELTYIEGCTAPVYTPDRLHVSAIEVLAMPASRVRYIALQNFSKEVDNLVTKRARVHEAATLEWVDVNLGSRRTRKVPRAELVGPGARADYVGVSFAGKGQQEDVGAEMVHIAPRTRSRIANHGMVQKGGQLTLRSGVQVAAGATEVASSVEWSSLMLDADSRVETAPAIEVDEADAEIVQE
ncbi:MAG TPA: SufD family Fe-S cluster assembly protein, partial [Thermoplasmata archaeon]|nr:SufD family Fe-S cluster assembly protein [Thermoplasmata archaeon]